MIFKRTKCKVKKPKMVDTRVEAEWIIKNCTDKYSKETIMEILDYELFYLGSIGLTKMTKEEFKECLEYWSERNK